jgi:Spy/CpxP family protein refolding chaperone
MEKTKLLTIAVFALLILNFGTLGFLILRPPPPLGGQGGNKARLIATLMADLKFDKAQEAAYEKLLSEHRGIRQNLENILNEEQEKLFKSLRTGDTSAIVQIRAIKGELELETFKHLRAFRAICTPEQAVKFDDLIIGVLRRSNPNPPRK